MPLKQHFTIAAIIVGCVAVFLMQQVDDAAMVDRFATVPKAITAAWQSLTSEGPSADGAQTFGTLFTAALLHGDVTHILYNMVFLWMFGSLASQHLGPWWAAGVFIVTAIAGSTVQVLLKPDSPIPVIGASGAVCGFEGLYLGLAMRWDMDWPDVWPIAHPIPPLQLGAVAIVGLVFDVTGLMDHSQGIAYGAHIGGTLAGLTVAAVLTTLHPTEGEFNRSRLSAGKRRLRG